MHYQVCETSSQEILFHLLELSLLCASVHKCSSQQHYQKALILALDGAEAARTLNKYSGDDTYPTKHVESPHESVGQLLRKPR